MWGGALKKFSPGGLNSGGAFKQKSKKKIHTRKNLKFAKNNPQKKQKKKH